MMNGASPLKLNQGTKVCNPKIFFKIFLKCVLLIHYSLFTIHSTAQNYTHADTLRGSNGEGRNWWNATKYNLHVKFNIADSSISGYNVIDIQPLKRGEVLQIDLQSPMIIDSIIINNSVAKYQRDGNAYFISISTNKPLNQLTIYYHGKPQVAKFPPWDGGIIWKKDKQGSPFVSIACQGLGASVWYPCKDYQGDEPDSAEMYITIPDSLQCIGNGRLRDFTKNSDGTATYNWAVVNPINSYNIIPYIGKYTNFNEVYKGEQGDLDMDYWVLDSNINKAKAQFKDAPKMMKAFEYWFGSYPFYKDGYKLIESPHLGMEHQSAIAYGNGYKNGYMGRDLSGSGWGLKWDFIIIHESGHEWFANNITTKDIADMWVHEGFTCYSETLFTEYYYGKEAATAYIVGLRKNIENDKPIIGDYNVNKEGSVDMYYKGANMIHTIRQIINDDSLFRVILRSLNKNFYHQTVTAKQVQDCINEYSKINFNKVFQQYLHTTKIPTLEYKLEKDKILYRYTNCIKDFDMPLKIRTNKEQWIIPTEQWQTLLTTASDEVLFTVDQNFYINTKKVK